MSDDDDGWGVPVDDGAFEEMEGYEDLQREAPPEGEDEGGLGDVVVDLARTLSLPIDLALVRDTMAALVGRVPYRLGGKPSSIKLDTDQFLAERKAPNGVDCSGFVRWLLFRASGGQVKIPDGSWHQREHFTALAKASGLPLVPYTSCSRIDGVLRVAGFTASKAAGIKVGHIWLVLDGQTCESRGHRGVDRRAWDTPALKKLAAWCVQLR